MGRGGQNIKVVPALNAIVVTTGSGFEYDQINPFLAAAFIDPDRPLPTNPVGWTNWINADRLGAASTPLCRLGPLPDTAKAISGKTYVFEPNALEVETEPGISATPLRPP